MLDLSSVTLVATASTPEYVAGTVAAIRKCQAVARFANTVIFSCPASYGYFAQSVEFVRIPLFESWEGASVAGFEAYKYEQYFADHILCIGWDSWILDQDAWTDEFLEYDWVGAPWPDGVVGNSGFGLISKRLLLALEGLPTALDVESCHPFDARICRHEWNGKPGYRERLEAIGMRWAPIELARRFSVENEPYAGSFGFHGKETLCSVAFQGLL